MGLFENAGSANANFGGNYPKPGQYVIIINTSKYTEKTFKSGEAGIFECSIVHVSDKALWTGDPKAVPVGKDGQHLLNLPGEEYKPGNPMSLVFPDRLVGNGARLRKIVITAYDVKDDQFPKGGTEAAERIKYVFDPAAQPLRDVMIEMRAAETTTKGKEKIVGANYLRRVYAEEMRQMWAEHAAALAEGKPGKLEQGTIDLLSKDGRLTRMLDVERKEQEERRNVAAVGK